MAISDGRMKRFRRPVAPLPTYHEPSARWSWKIPKTKVHPGCCTEVVDASRNWWEYLLDDQKPYCSGQIIWAAETWGYYQESYGDAWPIMFKADFPIVQKDYEGDDAKWGEPRWRSPITMPEEVARIFLRITDVWAEPLQVMCHEDVLLEGVKECLGYSPEEDCDCIYFEYMKQWDKKYGKKNEAYKYISNPWTWVFQFEQCTRPFGH
jgi:hypothetical protein